MYLNEVMLDTLLIACAPATEDFKRAIKDSMEWRWETVCYDRLYRLTFFITMAQRRANG